VRATVPVVLGKVIVLSESVVSAAVKVVSKSFALEPSKTIFPLAILIEFAASATPDINVVEAKEVNPAIVDAVAPSATAVLPIVISSF